MSNNISPIVSRCRYFNGTINKVCKKKVNYRNLVGGIDFGWAARLPCIKDSPLRKKPLAKCESHSPLTEEEVIAKEKEINEYFDAMLSARQLIVKTEKNSGTVKCPLCKKDLSFLIAASNGHIRATCITEKCLSWIE